MSSVTGDGITTDIFDTSQGASVLSSSPMIACCGGSQPQNSFGGSFGVEVPHTLFADGPEPGSIDFINFQTGNLIDLTGYNAILADDSDDPANPGNPNRGSSSFSLFSSPDDTFTTLNLISTTALPSSYASNYGANSILISDTFAPVQAQFFRIEVARTTAGGPRIREIDGVGEVAVPEPASAALVALGAVVGLVRRRARNVAV
ncbi:MAG TPA: PEP-CTERM sorting domain-containing protein [Chthoniobacteraceae bacterium]|nr:PEP-CTERM sorting domain-containing protein [Chthoniobacteraceae bacterium]